MRIAQYNNRILLERHDTARENEQHSYFLSDFTLDQHKYEANTNAWLARLQHTWERKFATAQAEMGRRQAGALRLKAKSVEKFGREDRIRHTKAGRAQEGMAQTRVAASGVTLEGSPMEVLVEQAEQLELQRLDILTRTQTEAQDLRYAADVQEFEANMGEKMAYFRSGVTKFLANVQQDQTMQAGVIAHNDMVRTAYNWRNQALDYKDQAKISMMEAEQQAYGLMAQAGATRRAGRAALFGGVANAGIGLGKALLN